MSDETPMGEYRREYWASHSETPIVDDYKEEERMEPETLEDRNKRIDGTLQYLVDRLDALENQYSQTVTVLKERLTRLERFSPRVLDEEETGDPG